MRETLTLAFLNEPGAILDRMVTLSDAIKHGDAEHQAWLEEAITAHLTGQPVPPPHGVEL